MDKEFFKNLNPVCNHSWVYKILHDHTAADCCELCGEIRPQAIKYYPITPMRRNNPYLTKTEQMLNQVISIIRSNELSSRQAQDLLLAFAEDYMEHQEDLRAEAMDNSSRS